MSGLAGVHIGRGIVGRTGPIIHLVDTCPGPEDLCVTFSGLGTCRSVNHGFDFFYEVLDAGLNGTFGVTKVLETGGIKQWEGPGGAVRMKKYSYPAQELIEDCYSTDSIIVVQCVNPTQGTFKHTHSVWYRFDEPCLSSFGFSPLSIFRGLHLTFTPSSYDHGIQYYDQEDNFVNCDPNVGVNNGGYPGSGAGAIIGDPLADPVEVDDSKVSMNPGCPITNPAP